MTDQPRAEPLPPATVAWLSVSEQTTVPVRAPTGPLGLQILPLASRTVPFSFHGGRLRATRCIWSASTVSGARLLRVGRPGPVAGGEPTLQVLASVECDGSVFDASDHRSDGVLRVLDPSSDVDEQFPTNTHLYTLNVPVAAVGLEASAVMELTGSRLPLTGLQLQLLRSAGGLLDAAVDELTTTTRLVGMDRYLGALSGLLLRTAVPYPEPAGEQVESVRTRVDAIIRVQAADPALTPAAIAGQLAISLRQLYRAFNGAESPAARIRRRRLELAAELLTGRPPSPHVEVVAQQCGFVSAEYFSRAFRREFGLSPRAYRAAHRQLTAAD